MVGAYILGSTLRSWKSNMSTIDESPVFEMPPAKKPTVRLSCYGHNTYTHTHPGIRGTARDEANGTRRPRRERPTNTTEAPSPTAMSEAMVTHLVSQKCMFRQRAVSAILSIFSW